MSRPPINRLTLARLANDGMHDICAKYPDRFPAWVASVPMNNVKATLDEIARAVEKMGAKGIQIFTNVNGRPLGRSGVLADLRENAFL